MLTDPRNVRRYAPLEYDEMPSEMVTSADYDDLLRMWEEERARRATLESFIGNAEEHDFSPDPAHGRR